MIKLKKEKYKEVLKLLDPESDSIEVLCILKLQANGLVFVSDDTNIKDFLIYSAGLGGFFLQGKSKDFATVVKDFVTSEDELLKSLKIEYFEASCKDDELLNSLYDQIEDEDKHISNQYVYKYFDKTKPATHKNCFNFEIKNVMDLMEDIESYTILKDRIETFWTSLKLFKNKGFGYCVLDGKKIVSICISAFITNKFAGFEVETFEGYKQMGFCKVIASMSVSDALDRGLIPYWDCMEENIPSRKTAESIGFKKSSQYKLLGASI